MRVNVRIIAATHRDLATAVREGKFRSDLFYRLNVLPLHIPALRERKGDVPLLTMFFVQRFAKKFGKPVKQVSEETLRQLTSYSWPGNIRELQNVIERAVVLSSGNSLAVAPDFAPDSDQLEEAPALKPEARSVMPEAARKDVATSLEEVERQHIESVLKQTNWMIEGERGAAKLLNLNPSTLRSRMQKLDIKRPGKPA